MIGGLSVAATLILLFLALVLFVLAVFLPWFVYRISKEVKETNRLLRLMVKALTPEGSASELIAAGSPRDFPEKYLKVQQ